MYLQLIKLTRYKRLMMSNIQSFEWTPTKSLMVIIGSNGSGKSSLLDEMSPLPSHHSQFETGGTKTVHCMHNGSRYVMHSVYDRGTGHHTFIKDDEKLNDNGTYQMQLDLCKQEFAMQQDIQDVLTGRTKFSQLPVNKRRDWLTRMSPVDLGFAFNLLSKVMEQAKSNKNVVDHMTKRLANENTDMLDDAEITRLRQERQRLTDRVNHLFRFRNPAVKPFFNSVDEARTSLDGIVQDAKFLLRKHPRLSNNIRVSGKGEYTQLVNDRLADIQVSQGLIDHLIEDLEKTRALAPSQIDKITPEELSDLNERLDYHMTNAEQAKDIVTGYLGDIPLCQTGMYGDQHAKLEDVFDRLYGIIMTIPENSDGALATNIAREKKEKLVEFKTKLRSVEEFISETMKRIATLKGCDHVQCPNCQHTFVPGVDPLDIPKLEERLRNASAAEVRLTAEIKAIDEYLEKYVEYAGYVQQFQQIARDHRDYQPVMEWVSGGETRLFRSPRSIATNVIQWHNAQKALVESDIQIEQAKVLETRLKVIESIDFDAAGYMLQRVADLEADINNKLLAQKATRDALETYVFSGNQVDRYVQEVQAIIDRYSHWRAGALQQSEWLLDRAFETEIDATHQQLATVGNQLREAERRDIEIRLIEETVEDAADAHSDFQLLAKALSPKGGLIGKYMLGFLQGVTKLVNTVIDEVWTYPMEVLPAKVDRDDLDYKFPLRVANGAVEAADIDYGSDSQKEIVNFAFMVAMRKFMGYDEYPLILDEFGRTFDEQHRANLIPFISRLIELGVYKQIFYISHFESTHGAFNQAEIIVMDPTNVTVPEVYNKNVVVQ